MPCRGAPAAARGGPASILRKAAPSRHRSAGPAGRAAASPGSFPVPLGVTARLQTTGRKAKEVGGEKGGRGSRPRLRTHRVGRFHHVLDGTPHAGQAQPHGGPHHRQGRRSVRGRRRLGRRRRRRRQRLRPRPSPSAAFRQGPPRHGAGGGAGMAASGPPRWRWMWMWRASAVGTAAARFQGVLPEATQTNSAQKAQGRAVFY